MEDLDKELASEVGLVIRESFNSDENGRGGDDEGVQGIEGRGWEKGKPNRLGGKWGCVGRLVSARG